MTDSSSIFTNLRYLFFISGTESDPEDCRQPPDSRPDDLNVDPCRGRRGLDDDRHRQGPQRRPPDHPRIIHQLKAE